MHLHGSLLPLAVLGGLSIASATALLSTPEETYSPEMLLRAPRWNGVDFDGTLPSLDSGYKHWDLCAHAGRVETHPAIWSLPTWGPAAITGASGCGSCAGATTYNGSPKTAGLGLQLAPPHDLFGDPGQLPPSPTDHPYVLADTGEVVYTETDFVLKGTGFDFVFTRTYRSALDYEGWLGHGWTHSAECYLIELANGDVKSFLGDGRISDAYDEDAGSYTPPDGTYDTLTTGTRPVGHDYAGETYFTKTEKNGVVWEFDLGHDGADNIYVCTSITDQWGNDFTFEYAALPPTTGTARLRLATLTCPDGQEADFHYDTGNDFLEYIEVSNTSTHADYGDLRIDYSRDTTHTDMLIKAEKHKTRKWVKIDNDDEPVRPYTSYDYYTSGIEVKNLKTVHNSTTVTDDFSFKFEYETTGTDRCKKVTDADGEVHQYAHDQNFNSGGVTYDYAKYTDPGNQRRDFVYTDLSGGDRVIKRVQEHLEDEDGTDLTGTYDLTILRECDCQRITELQYSDGSKETWHYDSNGNVDEYTRGGTGTTGTLRKKWQYGSFANNCRLEKTTGWLREEASPGWKITYAWDLTNGTLNTVTWPSVTSGQPSSQSIVWDYDLSGTDGTLETIKDPEGHTTDYDWVGRELTITAGTDVAAEERVISVTKYDLMGNVEWQHGPYGGATDKWEYDVTMDRRVLQVDGPEGELTTHNYDLAGRRDKSTQTISTGVTVDTDYTISLGGRMTEMVGDDGVGNLNATTTYTLEEVESDRYSKTIDPDGYGPKSKWGYGSHNLPWKEYQRDESDPDSGNHTETLVTTLERDTMGRVTARVTMGGDRIEYGYDGYGRRTSTTTLLHEEDNEPPVDDELTERIVQLTLKDWGAVEESKTVVEATVGATKTSKDWSKTTYHYDEAIRQYKTVRSDVVTQSPDTPLADITTEVVLDKNGRAATRKDANGKSWLTEWTSAGDVKKTTDPVGNISETSYDDANRKITRTDKDWDTSATPPAIGGTYVSETHYDKSGRMSSSKNKGSGTVYRTATYDYNLAGQTTKVTLPGSRETAYEYDELGRVDKETVDIDATTTAITETTWSLGGRRDEVKDGNGKITKWTYDAFGRETKVDYPTGSGAWDDYQKTYDTHGRLSTVTDPEGAVLTYGYDDGGRRVTVDITKTGTLLEGPDRLYFEYDDMDRVTLGKTQTGSDPSWTDVTTVEREYDPYGRMGEETQHGSRVLAFEYDSGGGLKELTYPSGGPIDGVEWECDDAGRVKKVSRKLSGGTMTAVANLYYEGGREVKRTQTPYDLTRTQTWTNFRKPEELKYVEDTGSTLLTGLFNEWSADEGYLVVRDRLHDASGGTNKGEVYRYDEMGRLTHWWTDVDDPQDHDSTDPTADYGDKVEHEVGKVYERTEVKVTPEGGSATTTSYTVNDGYQITDVGADTWAWDDNGELTNDDTWKYEWTALGQLHRAYDHASEDARTFTYDAFGRRVETEVASTPAANYEYLYHGWHMIGEHDGSDWLWQEVPAQYGEAMYEHVALDTIDHDNDSSTTDYVGYAPHTDFQETAWGLSDADGVLVEKYVQDDPYGVTHTIDADTGNLGDYGTRRYHRKRLHGGVVDAVLEIYDFRNRWLKPEEGTWMSRDPLGQIDSWNLLQSLRSRPLTAADRYGLWAVFDPPSNSGACFRRIVLSNGSFGPANCPNRSWKLNACKNGKREIEELRSNAPRVGSVVTALCAAEIHCECEGCPPGKSAVTSPEKVEPIGIRNTITFNYFEVEAPSWEFKIQWGETLCCPCFNSDSLYHEGLHAACNLQGRNQHCRHPGAGATEDEVAADNAKWNDAEQAIQNCLSSGSATSEACKKANATLGTFLP